MREKYVQLLTGIGLDATQARVYVAVLELGEATVQQIAQKTKIKRTSLYFILDRLAQNGLVHQSRTEKKSYFVAEDPQTLQRQRQERFEEFQRHVEILRALQKKNTHRSRVLYFNSFDGFKQIWKTIFESGVKEYLIITDPREMLRFVRKDYITNRIIKEKLRLGIRSRQLIMPSQYANEITHKDKHENRQSRVLPYNFPIPFTTIIFDDRVALISPFEEDLIIIIESLAFAKTQASLFEAMWQSLPAPK